MLKYLFRVIVYFDVVNTGQVCHWERRSLEEDPTIPVDGEPSSFISRNTDPQVRIDEVFDQ